MRRQIIILSLLLAICSITFAQGTFPEDLAGDRAIVGESLSFQMYLDRLHNMYPWSMPDPVGRAWWFGELTIEVCDYTEQATMQLHTFALRHCVEAPWGVPPGVPNLICYYHAPREINRLSYLSWNETCECYIALYLGTSERIGFESLTLNEDSLEGLYKTGYFLLEEGEYVYDMSLSISTYTLEEFTVEQIGLIRRGVTRRLAVESQKNGLKIRR